MSRRYRMDAVCVAGQGLVSRSEWLSGLAQIKHGILRAACVCHANVTQMYCMDAVYVVLAKAAW